MTVETRRCSRCGTNNPVKLERCYRCDSVLRLTAPLPPYPGDVEAGLSPVILTGIKIFGVLLLLLIVYTVLQYSGVDVPQVFLHWLAYQ